MASRSFGAGSFGYGPNIHEQSKSEFDVDARRRLDGLEPVNQLTPEQVKQAFQEAVQADQAQQNQAVSITNGEAFLAGHPEFRKTDGNIALMNHELVSRFGVRAYSIADYEEAYASLRSSNFLNLDRTVLAAQERTTAKQRYEQEKAHIAATTFDPNADYSGLSLEELRNRAIEEHQRQLQAAGERGGNGW